MSASFESEKRRLEMKAISRNLAELSLEDQKKLINGLENVPTKKILDQAQYLNNVMLPRIAGKKGIDSDDYKFYKDVVASLLWAISIIDRYEFIRRENASLLIMREFLREELITCKGELNKYQTAEDMLMNSSFEKYASAVAKRAEDLLKGQ